jgi:hypothetical protein
MREEKTQRLRKHFYRYLQIVEMIIMFQQGSTNIYGTTFPNYTPKLRYTVIT